MSAVSSGLTYLATARAPATAEPQQFSRALAVSETPRAALRDQVPVKFVNPFDTTEIFEFPPGTSETDVRDAVAELLLHRARDRQASGELRLHSRRSAEGEHAEHVVKSAEAG